MIIVTTLERFVAIMMIMYFNKKYFKSSRFFVDHHVISDTMMYSR